MKYYKESTTKLLNNEKFSDFTIVCGTTGREYKAHRFVISSQSKWFDRCCSRDDLIEGQQRRAVLKEDDPLALERMIEYFYKFDYSDDVSAVNQSHKSPASVASRGTIADVVAGSITEFPIQLHAHVYAIADKYEVPDLKSIARDKFREELAKNMDSTKIMGAAIAALYLEIELPDSDRKLKDLLAIAWIIPGNRRVTELHTDCLKHVLMAVPDFLFDVQNLLLQGYPGGIDFPDFMCPECDELSIVQPKDTGELWTKASIQCNQCDVHVLPSKFRLNEHLEVERWWAPKHVR